MLRFIIGASIGAFFWLIFSNPQDDIHQWCDHTDCDPRL